MLVYDIILRLFRDETVVLSTGMNVDEAERDISMRDGSMGQVALVGVVIGSGAISWAPGVEVVYRSK